MNTAADSAIAIRMGIAAAGQPSPIVKCNADQGPAALSLAADASPKAIADVVSRHVRDTGRSPAIVAVGDSLSFSVTDIAASREGRLREVIALVTGSAQGFGKGIVAALAAEGAHVAVADINVTGGTAFAAELNAQYGEDTATFVEMNIADSASLKTAMETLVETFGGLDMLIANAGVLRAGGLDEMDEASFDLVTAVNYKGFFLSVRAAADVMKRQHTIHPDRFADIIQINSKSGLAGSNRNFAYAGSKFGAIGLVQSFAMELVEANIKVNAVCPGNYFDGPLWSDPERGLFVQYLKAGKVAGAKTLDDVKQDYLSKVPMKRGCTPDDVARAIVYLHEQHYETGQALPVTGGQIMLR